jgi:pimeloyl-ACP methyl ester carboxylesterase
VLARLEGDERAAVERITEDSLGEPDATLHSTYSRAVYPAWFVDREMALRFKPPEASSQTGAAALARLRRDGYDWRALLRTVETSTLLIHGAGDALPATTAADTSYILPNARSTVVPASGHMPFWEVPELFFPLVVSFLRA